MLKKKFFAHPLIIICILGLLFTITPNNSIAKKSQKNQKNELELVELISSLKDSIGSLNTRILDIENKLDTIEENKKDNSINNKWNSFSTSKSHNDKDTIKNETEEKKEIPIIKNDLVKAISVKKELEQGFNVGSIYIGTEKVIAYKSSAGGFSPYERAQKVADKIQKHIDNGGDFQNLNPIKRNGMFVGDINGEAIFTVDKQTANRTGVNPASLTIAWVNNVRSAFGISKVQRLASLNTSRSLSASGRQINGRSKNSDIIEKLLPISSSDFSKVLFGGASWYGPYFHGRRSADGSRFNMHEMTAAHKSLPFGTIVKVTNLNNKKSCIVRITDRGPYIHGRIIDLSKAAAQQVGMLSSGTASVKVEIIGTVKKKK